MLSLLPVSMLMLILLVVFCGNVVVDVDLDVVDVDRVVDVGV